MLHQRSPRASLPPCSRCPRSALKRADSVFPNSSRTCIWELHDNTSLTSLSGVNGLGWFLLIWQWFHYVCIMMYCDVRWFIRILSWCFRAIWSVWRARLQIYIWALHKNQACPTKLYESILGYLRGSLFSKTSSNANKNSPLSPEAPFASFAACQEPTAQNHKATLNWG